jgi:hypothetical protein
VKGPILEVGVTILSVAYFAEPVAAQTVNDLVGSWEFTIELPQRGGGGGGGGRGGFGFPQTLVFSLDGAALQGTLGNEAAGAELTSVMLEGNEITFTAARQTQRGSFELTYTGEIAEESDTMTGTFEVPQRGGFTIPWTATRTDDN